MISRNEEKWKGMVTYHCKGSTEDVISNTFITVKGLHKLLDANIEADISYLWLICNCEI